eukprot:c24560_g1_i1 orf=898-2334(+)
MLLDLLESAPRMHGTISAAGGLSSLHEELSFTEILSSCLPETASSMSLLQILQEGVAPNDAIGLHTHAESQIFPLIYNSTSQHDDKQQYINSKNQNSCRETSCLPEYAALPCVNGHNSAENSAWLQSPCQRFNEAQQPTTSSGMSEPLSTLDNTEAGGEVAFQNQQICRTDSGSLYRFSHGDTLRREDAAQYSSQTSLDEESSIQMSIQEGMPSGHHLGKGSNTCHVAPHAHTLIEETCSLENYSTCDVPADTRGARGVTTAPRSAKKRKRTRVCKNSEEVESQRMTHIAVERNRRKQMNEHLNVLRSLMPAAYIQRGDQASIIGGAINFVKELENVLQVLQKQKQLRDCKDIESFLKQDGGLISKDLMHFPHYAHTTKCSYNNTPKEIFAHLACEGVTVEVKLNGSSAFVKVLAQKIPHQLYSFILSIQRLHLEILHLSITTTGQSVMYSFNLEVQGDSQSQTAHDIAKSIQIFFRI